MSPLLRGRVPCRMCVNGWHPECWGGRCACRCNQDEGWLAENPAYGPGNPDWERDFRKDSE